MPRPPRLTVLSIDGVPHGLLNRLMAGGDMPNFARLCQEHGQPRMMRSIQPTVSSVAWACYNTGRNPGKHGLYGFIDREPGTRQLAVGDASVLAGRHLWQIMSDAGQSVFGMNVPSTYPPRPVNGVLIGDFLAPSLEDVAYPPAVNDYLQSIHYRIDVDAASGRKDKHRLLADLDITLAKREEAMFHFLGQRDWDFFHTHVMGTDRINHFLLDSFEQGHATFAPAFVEYYRKVDAMIGRLVQAIADQPLLMLSDHGFCPVLYEVQLTSFLVQSGWTTPDSASAGPLAYDPSRSRAFNLIPGRIYVNLAGREADGCVPPAEYEPVRQSIAADLLALRDPQGRAVVRKVIKREDLYWPGGDGPTGRVELDCHGPYGHGPDLVAVPFDGYDLKMGPPGGDVFVRTELEGMHTYGDALCFARGVQLPDDDLEIRQLAGPILATLGVTPPADLDLEAVPEPAGMSK